MPISVRDIQEKEFSRQKRDGYNIEEVDDFLDEISDQLSVLIRENMALAEQVKTLRATRVNAQRIADETVADARKKAQEVISSAEEQAATTVSNAKVEAESIKAEADNIRKTIATYRANFRRLVEGQVQVLKETDSLFD